ncbi:MAG: 4Fe-4S binding protein [Nitrospirae bacterium]|nr:MAG: 4Fe-4S binding protein [Nitrospirota bacterium]
MSTDKKSQESEVSRHQSAVDSQQSTVGGRQSEKKTKLPLSKLRRFVMFGILVLFLLQFVNVKVLVGGLTGSAALWSLNLIDVFAYLESFSASRVFTKEAFFAVVAVSALYLIFGRAFCGWVCPMDFLYEMVDKAKKRGASAFEKVSAKIPPGTGYVIAAFLLFVSWLLGVPFFSNYVSHLTNFFRAVTGVVSLGLGLPVDRDVVIYSVSVILFLLLFEFFFPRLWCRALCPVGKVYGLFNKVSLLRLGFVEGRQCGECMLCDQTCYMKVKIAMHVDKSSLRDTNCIYCGRCAEGCETKGRLIKFKLWR